MKWFLFAVMMINAPEQNAFLFTKEFESVEQCQLFVVNNYDTIEEFLKEQFNGNDVKSLICYDEISIQKMMGPRFSI